MKLKRLRGYWAGFQLLRDPSKLDQVFALDDAIPDHDEVLAHIADTARRDPGGAKALAERHRLSIDLAALRDLPEGTFGRTAARFFDDNQLDPKSIPSLEGDDEAAWVKAHLYETHDIWHVATGFGTDIAGEIGLQAFYAAQLPGGRLPMLLVPGGLLHAAFWQQDDFRPRMASVAHGWDAGQRAKPLFGVRWDTLWTLPLAEVRSLIHLAA